eukprot:1729207-Rhodomonas_salina.1
MEKRRGEKADARPRVKRGAGPQISRWAKQFSGTNQHDSQVPTCLPTYLPACLPTPPPTSLPTSLPTHPPTYLPTCLSACLPACLPTYQHDPEPNHMIPRANGAFQIIPCDKPSKASAHLPSPPSKELFARTEKLSRASLSVSVAGAAALPARRHARRCAEAEARPPLALRRR